LFFVPYFYAYYGFFSLLFWLSSLVIFRLKSASNAGRNEKPIMKETHSYPLRGIDPDLWLKICHFCLDEGITKKEFILEAMRFFMENVAIGKKDE